VLLAAACNNDDTSSVSTTTTTRRSTTTTSTASPSTSTETTPTAAPGRPCVVPGASDAAQHRGGDTLLLLDDVSVGTAGCATAITFTFLNPSTDPPTAPGYSIGYEPAPLRSEGAGNEVSVAGSAYLVLRLSPVATVNLSVDPFVITYDGPNSLVPDTGPVKEVRSLGSFEAQTTWAIGVDERRPFAVAATSDPMRLVVTIG